MKYDLQVARGAEKEIARLDRTMQTRVRTALRELADDPRPDGCTKLKGQMKDHYRVRVGNVRVVYRVDDGNLVVLVVTVDKRGDIY